jgi:hypothetical protein
LAQRAFIASDFLVEHDFFHEIADVSIAADLSPIVVVCYPDHLALLIAYDPT